MVLTPIVNKDDMFYFFVGSYVSFGHSPPDNKVNHPHSARRKLRTLLHLADATEPVEEPGVISRTDPDK